MSIETTLSFCKSIFQNPSSWTLIHESTSTEWPYFWTVGECCFSCFHKTLGSTQRLSNLRIGFQRAPPESNHIKKWVNHRFGLIEWFMKDEALAKSRGDKTLPIIEFWKTTLTFEKYGKLDYYVSWSNTIRVQEKGHSARYQFISTASHVRDKSKGVLGTLEWWISNRQSCRSLSIRWGIYHSTRSQPKPYFDWGVIQS